MFTSISKSNKKSKAEVLKEFNKLAEETKYITREIILGDGVESSKSEWLRDANPGDKLMLEVDIEGGLIIGKQFNVRINEKTYYANEPRNRYFNKITADELETILDGVDIELAEPQFPYDNNNSLSKKERAIQNKEIFKEIVSSEKKSNGYKFKNNVDNGRTRFNRALKPGDDISFEINKGDGVLGRDRYFVLANGVRSHVKDAPEILYDEYNSMSKRELKDFMTGIEIDR